MRGRTSPIPRRVHADHGARRSARTRPAGAQGPCEERRTRNASVLRGMRSEPPRWTTRPSQTLAYGDSLSGRASPAPPRPYRQPSTHPSDTPYLVTIRNRGPRPDGRGPRCVVVGDRDAQGFVEGLFLLGVQDKVAIITGAGRGIGAAAAVALAEAGADVVITSRTEADLAEVAAKIEETGRRARIVPADLSAPEAAAALADAAVKTFGRLDVVVNNVGGTNPRPLLETNHPTTSKNPSGSTCRTRTPSPPQRRPSPPWRAAGWV
ncbi:SDR family NAD(P)-dependent oxidoreductase [Streptomyces sp. CoH27]|uniref:SDR family NAD(P)-dependent oxidoreductase n=1 Tax=Streptomyces sp. CoH27 TaxID=2875763 RepID=UPI0027DFBAEC|nr:SDR family NAD(P)-dependent oxidoreductase [Streptomyces sp. CoH27]